MPKLAPPKDDVVTLADAIEAWQRSMRANNLAPKTQTTYGYAASKLVAHLGAGRPLAAITRRDHEAMLDALALAPASKAGIYRSLRAFWAFAVAHDELPVERDPMNGMKAPTIPEKAVEFPSDAQLRAILATCQAKSRHNFRGVRDEAIIRVLASTGARLSEIADLELDDVDLPGAAVRVMGKGRRERWLPLDEPTLLALKRYLDRERPRSPFAFTTTRVWVGPAGAFTSGGIAQMFTGRAESVKVKTHVHALRHRAISGMLKAGLSEGDTMALSGHRSRSMMDRYGRFDRAQRAHDAFRKATASGALPKL
jgi:integrase/recombinase XerC